MNKEFEKDGEYMDVKLKETSVSGFKTGKKF